MNESRPTVRLADFYGLLERAELSMAQVGRELPEPVSRSYIFRVVHAYDAVTPRWERDVPAVIARHIEDMDVSAIRAAIFTYPDDRCIGELITTEERGAHATG